MFKTHHTMDTSQVGRDLDKFVHGVFSVSLIIFMRAIDVQLELFIVHVKRRGGLGAHQAFEALFRMIGLNVAFKGLLAF